ncbi:helix-turn-helix domain-containing protein [Pseudomonas aeruginosa]|uniref:helix-turn-helix domain-containing protein n=1 Tax=Pseudomonas aeruginosa TaxID=287 RepID=UPI001E3AFC12|nr:helix-turn-helix transcriptional regulator [Pseudomonas aeruginosa]UGR44426.1 helix-turn-helix domain-containing protein [Pseudomonas aeruginosa]
MDSDSAHFAFSGWSIHQKYRRRRFISQRLRRWKIYRRWEYAQTMKKRELEAWELEECIALKRAVEAFNEGKPRKDRISQSRLADALGINQGSVSAYLNGVNALNAKVASIIAGMIGIPVEQFSPRLAKEISSMAAVAQPPASSRRYQDDLYKSAPAEQRADVDDIAEKLLKLSPAQARKLKQAMDLLIPDDGSAKD